MQHALDTLVSSWANSSKLSLRRVALSWVLGGHGVLLKGCLRTGGRKRPLVVRKRLDKRPAAKGHR